MKITQEEEFRPITITLETELELAEFFSALVKVDISGLALDVRIRISRDAKMSPSKADRLIDEARSTTTKKA